jgi:hypothetical protein
MFTHLHKDILWKESIYSLSKEYPSIFYPAVSNGERVGKLSVEVEGFLMHMLDFFCCLAAPLDASVAARCFFAQDDRMLQAVILHQVLSETWGYPTKFNRLSAIMQ